MPWAQEVSDEGSWVDTIDTPSCHQLFEINPAVLGRPCLHCLLAMNLDLPSVESHFTTKRREDTPALTSQELEVNSVNHSEYRDAKPPHTNGSTCLPRPGPGSDISGPHTQFSPGSHKQMSGPFPMTKRALAQCTQPHGAGVILRPCHIVSSTHA